MANRISVETSGDPKADPTADPPTAFQIAVEERATYGIVSYKNWARLTPRQRIVIAHMSATQARKWISESR